MSWGSTWAFLFNYNKFISSYSSQVTPFSYSESTTSPPVICTTTATSICHLQRLFQPTINSSTNIFSSNNYHHIGININTCTVIPSTVNLQYYPPYWHWTTDSVDTGPVASPKYDTAKFGQIWIQFGKGDLGPGGPQSPLPNWILAIFLMQFFNQTHVIFSSLVCYLVIQGSR